MKKQTRKELVARCDTILLHELFVASRPTDYNDNEWGTMEKRLRIDRSLLVRYCLATGIVSSPAKRTLKSMSRPIHVYLGLLRILRRTWTLQSAKTVTRPPLR